MRLAIPIDHAHRPAIIQMEGRTYFPDDPLFLQMGTHLAVVISDRDADIYTEEVVDAFSMMQILHSQRKEGDE